MRKAQEGLRLSKCVRAAKLENGYINRFEVATLSKFTCTSVKRMLLRSLSFVKVGLLFQWNQTNSRNKAGLNTSTPWQNFCVLSHDPKAKLSKVQLLNNLLAEKFSIATKLLNIFKSTGWQYFRKICCEIELRKISQTKLSFFWYLQN